MDELIDTFLYERHEVRLASQPMSPEEEDDHRNKAAHVTNGIKETGLLHEMPELKDLEDRLEVFVAQIFSKHLIGDLSRRVAISAGDEPESHATKFVVAGLDIMVTEDKRFYLLEVNVNPRIASPDTVADGIQDHLVGFMRDLMDLLVGKQSTNFISGSTLLAKRESSN